MQETVDAFNRKWTVPQQHPPSWGKCDDCKHYRWYYDRCEKWDCTVDSREVHNCWEWYKQEEGR